MPDAVEATRQDMEQETADELVDRERHDLLPIAAVTAVILVAEGDVRFVERDQSFDVLCSAHKLLGFSHMPCIACRARSYPPFG